MFCQFYYVSDWLPDRDVMMFQKCEVRTIKCNCDVNGMYVFIVLFIITSYKQAHEHNLILNRARL